ncbi:cmgc mapk protein kinase [Malassezia pachydermatis]|uniref:Mitogen-activated protein kinase n=1 Tax=Malassezia pachydermatis TaxID=77020 RepID=A0A0M8MKS7_9BASI|nr:cmgc mapk protein kinase [Malassezia pachydermatis]KOS13538.1 cmgc mapk protein kinase [Malassezia pachydermatis]
MLSTVASLSNWLGGQPSASQPESHHEKVKAHATSQPNNNTLAPLGGGVARHATRSRTRTRSKRHSRSREASLEGATPPGWSRYTSKDYPLSLQNLEQRGYHTFFCLRVPFHVKKRYSFVRELGIGSYGCVALAYDNDTGQYVAIKRISNFFDREILTRRTLREVVMLHHLKDCSNVIDVLEFDVSFIEFNEVYLILGACDADLSQIINSRQALSEAHIKYFMVQLIRAVYYMHSAHIIHRDIKPGNLLVNANCYLQVCDFGMSRAFETDDNDYLSKHKSSSGKEQDLSVSVCQDSAHRVRFPGGPLTDYVSTRWYRAPEVMLGYQGGYGPALDIWSVGCILAELLGGEPLFPGTDYVDQLSQIYHVLGTPSENVINKIRSKRAKDHLQSLPTEKSSSFSELFPSAPKQAIDLLSKLLHWDPQERITAGEALAHPWFERYRNVSFSAQQAPVFHRFREVELIHAPSDFKRALEWESKSIGYSSLSHQGTTAQQLDHKKSSSVHSTGRSDTPDLDRHSTYTEGDSSPPSSNSPGPMVSPHSSGTMASVRETVDTNPPTFGSHRLREQPSPSEDREQKVPRRTDNHEFSLLKTAKSLLHW